jgi:hypothetical protein
MTKEELENYLFTLEVCEKYLPAGTHPAHYRRLREIRRILGALEGVNKIGEAAR